jgi:hypothetical protein
MQDLAEYANVLVNTEFLNNGYIDIRKGEMAVNISLNMSIFSNDTQLHFQSRSSWAILRKALEPPNPKTRGHPISPLRPLPPPAPAVAAAPC